MDIFFCFDAFFFSPEWTSFQLTKTNAAQEKLFDIFGKSFSDFDPLWKDILITVALENSADALRLQYMIEKDLESVYVLLDVMCQQRLLKTQRTNGQVSYSLNPERAKLEHWGTDDKEVPAKRPQNEFSSLKKDQKLACLLLERKELTNWMIVDSAS